MLQTGKRISSQIAAAEINMFYQKYSDHGSLKMTEISRMDDLAHAINLWLRIFD
jgi:hypothetical protein